MEGWMLDFINTFGCFGVLLLIFVENVFPPIPSEAVLLFAGALTVTTAMNAPAVVLFATAGSLAGAMVLYALGRVLRAERLKKLLEGRLGQMTHLRPAHIERAERWFIRYQGRAVLICRCIPLVRSLISIPAGFARMRVPPFLVLTALGSSVWNTVLVCTGVWLGNAWETAMPYLDRYTHVSVIAMAALVLLAGGCLLLRRKRRRIGGKAEPSAPEGRGKTAQKRRTIDGIDQRT